MALLDTLKDRQDNKYISFWGLVSNIIAVDEERSDSSYASNETYPTVVEALLRLKLHEKVRYFIYDPDDFTFSQIDEPETDEAKLFLKILLPKSGKKLAPTEVVEIQNQFKNYFWLKESIEQVLPNGIVDFTNPLFFGAGELRPLEMNSSLINAASLIELQRLQERVDELEAEKSNGSFAMGTPTVSHGEPRTNEQLIKELADANAKIEQQDKELPYNSQMSVARMLYGILKEHKYDITATRGKANELIENASRIHGTPITRNFIAKWIELANQAKSDSTK